MVLQETCLPRLYRARKMKFCLSESVFFIFVIIPPAHSHIGGNGALPLLKIKTAGGGLDSAELSESGELCPWRGGVPELFCRWQSAFCF
jgi:hypothetical protein